MLAYQHVVEKKRGGVKTVAEYELTQCQAGIN